MRFFTFILTLLSIKFLSAEELNLYTTRHYDSDVEIFKEFTKETGIKINIISGKAKPLEKRILDEGESCIGDLFFLADAGRLVSAEKKRSL